MQWRWHPRATEGAPVRAQFDIAFVRRRCLFPVDGSIPGAYRRQEPVCSDA